MNELYLIQIDANEEILFPKLCPLCGEECTMTGKIKGHPDTSYWGGFRYLFGLTRQLELYAHKDCLKDITASRKVTTLFLLITLVMSISLFKFIDITWFNKGIILTVTLMIALPIGFWQVKKSGAIEFVNEDDVLEFTCRNETYATKLAHLNGVFIRRLKI